MQSYKEALTLPVLACLFSLCAYLLFHATNSHGTLYVHFVHYFVPPSGGVPTRERSHSEVAVRIRKGSIEATIPDEESSLLSDAQSPPPDYASLASMEEQQEGLEMRGSSSEKRESAEERR